MRTGLAGLTLRGRAFLAAGVTALLCAVLLGQGALVRIAILVMALPLLAAWTVGRRRPHLVVHRELAPRLVTAGQAARVALTVHNDHRRSPGALLVEDQMPYALGSRSRFVLQGLGRDWERTVSYPVRSEVRGQFEIGPLVSRAGDPFGLVEIRRVHPGSLALTVTPRTVPLPAIGLTGGWSGAGEHRPQAFATGSAEDVSVREYRRGDELRRVHWRSSAKTGNLMVRREEQPWEARATVFLDDRLRAHRGHGLASSFELGVTAAASVALHLEQHGYSVRLVTAEGTGREPVETMTAILERLALLQPTQRSGIDVSWSGEQARGGLVVAVLGSIEPTDTPALRRLHHDAGSALAIELDVGLWDRSPRRLTPTGGAAAGLGWRAVTVGPRDRLDSAWRDLGRSRHRRSAR